MLSSSLSFFLEDPFFLLILEQIRNALLPLLPPTSRRVETSHAVAKTAVPKTMQSEHRLFWKVQLRSLENKLIFIFTLQRDLAAQLPYCCISLHCHHIGTGEAANSPALSTGIRGRMSLQSSCPAAGSRGRERKLWAGLPPWLQIFKVLYGLQPKVFQDQDVSYPLPTHSSRLFVGASRNAINVAE